MTLDPIHVDNIARLAGVIADNVDDADHEDLALTVWEEWLTPLRDGGRTVAEPLAADDHERRSVPVEEVALTEPPFSTVHGLDSGTINPTTFKNGLVLDVAQAAMARTPSDLDVHRARSLVATVHAADATVGFPEDWISYDDGYGRRRVVHAPRVSRFAEGVVHALSLYLAESEHARTHANVVTDLLLLDGPIYPKELLNWRDREAELSELTTEAKPRSVVRNYVRLVETFVEKDVPLAGFVKNPSASAVVGALRANGVEAPWADDAALFTRLLERRRAPEEPTGPADGRRTDRLTFTSWLRSRGGVDRTLASDGDALGVERRLDPEAYEVTFFAVYDPRSDLLYKVEAPHAFTRDPETRRALTTQVLRDVAASRGPPPAIEKADALARIGRDEKAALRRRFERQFDAGAVKRYDDHRWGG